MTIKTYRKKKSRPVIAVQLDLDTDGFIYRKWGGEQKCKAGDWLVNNEGETYTVDKDSFRETYENISPGLYWKTSLVYAEVAKEPGSVETKEGRSHYKPGDYLVSNNEDGSDAYCIAADKFNAMYEEVLE